MACFIRCMWLDDCNRFEALVTISAAAPKVKILARMEERMFWESRLELEKTRMFLSLLLWSRLEKSRFWMKPFQQCSFAFRKKEIYFLSGKKENVCCLIKCNICYFNLLTKIRHTTLRRLIYVNIIFWHFLAMCKWFNFVFLIHIKRFRTNYGSRQKVNFRGKGFVSTFFSPSVITCLHRTQSNYLHKKMLH